MKVAGQPYSSFLYLMDCSNASKFFNRIGISRIRRTVSGICLTWLQGKICFAMVCIDNLLMKCAESARYFFKICQIIHSMHSFSHYTHTHTHTHRDAY